MHIVPPFNKDQTKCFKKAQVLRIAERFLYKRRGAQRTQLSENEPFISKPSLEGRVKDFKLRSSHQLLS